MSLSDWLEAGGDRDKSGLNQNITLETLRAARALKAKPKKDSDDDNSSNKTAKLLPAPVSRVSAPSLKRKRYEEDDNDNEPSYTLEQLMMAKMQDRNLKRLKSTAN
ncbi:hypothetical protein ABW20_dc0102030 [Dactylellina cionopaga]|nr:hypothetical protein ABW20_dc0102030 [Dactylellina cionopaga]